MSVGVFSKGEVMEGMLENNRTLPELKGKIYGIPSIDETFTKKGYSADAKLTGEEFEKVRTEIEELRVRLDNISQVV